MYSFWFYNFSRELFLVIGKVETHSEQDCAPTMKKKLEDIYANVGDLIARLVCEIHAVPTAQVTWFKDQQEVRVSLFINT